MLTITTVWGAVTGFLGKPWARKLILAAVGLAGALILYFQYVDARKDAHELSEALAASESRIAALEVKQAASERAILTRNELLDAISEQEGAEREATVKAIQKHPDWANQPIPDDVLNSLRK